MANLDELLWFVADLKFMWAFSFSVAALFVFVWLPFVSRKR